MKPPNDPLPAAHRRRLLASLGPYLFLLPNAIGLAIFTVIPIGAAFALSFVQWDAITPLSDARFVGLSNYIRALGFHTDTATGAIVPNDDRFWYFLFNSAFLLLGVPVGMFLSLLLALLLNRPAPSAAFLRTVYFIPTVCSSAAVAVLWRWLYNPQCGPIAAVLRAVGISPPDFLADPAWAKPAIIIMSLWASIGGYNCVLYLAGLQSIPPELYEAARIDGAGWWARLRYITWPLLAPTTFFILITSTIACFQGYFVAVHILTAGGPAGSTTTLLYYIYRTAFVYHHMGYAAALSMVLFAIVFGLTAAAWRLSRQAVQVWQ